MSAVGPWALFAAGSDPASPTFVIPMRSPSSPPTTGRYVIGEIALDLRTRVLHRPDGETELTQRVFDLFCLLISEPQVLHTRETLFERIWGTTSIEDSNLTQSIFVLRKALGDARKDWIRTLPKKGYRFEPPVEARLLAGECRPAPEATPLDVDPYSPAPPPVVTVPPAGISRTPLRLQRWQVLLALPLMLALSLPGSGRLAAWAGPGLAADGRTSSLPATKTIGVVLVDNDASSGHDDLERRATTLLREWVRWKLSLSPDVVLVEEEDLIAGRDMQTWVLELSAVRATPTSPATDRAEIRFMHRLRPLSGGLPAPDTAQVRHVDVSGPDDLSSAADRASNDVLAALRPSRRQDRWPALALGSALALRYADAIALARRSPPAAIAPLRALVRDAPGFGPGHLALAEVLAETGHLREADVHAASAAKRTAPLPTEARAVLEARIASVSTRRGEDAALAYARLASTYPARMDFVLGEALALLRSHRPEAAMPLLGGPAWERESSRLRLHQQVARAEAALVLGYLDEAQENATHAIGMIAADDTRDRRALGVAQRVLARARNQQIRTSGEPALYTVAAETFARGGYDTDAEVTRYFRAASINDFQDSARRFRPLVATLLERGNTADALRVQRSIADQYVSAGRREEGARIRREASRLAQVSGNTPMAQLLELDMVGEDLIAGDLDKAEQRLTQLRDNRLWTKYRFRVARLQSAALGYRGRHREALAALDDKLFGAERAQRLDVAPVEAAKIACARMETLLALGEWRLARAQLRSCRDAGSRSVPIVALLGEAQIDYHLGDHERARRLADRIGTLLAAHPRDTTYVGMGTDLAMLYTRLRDRPRAEALYRELQTTARPQGNALHLAEIDTGRAELAAMQGDWNTVARHATTVRARFPQRIWRFDSRLELLEIAHLQATGDIGAAQARARALAGRAHALGDAIAAAQASAFAQGTSTARVSVASRATPSLSSPLSRSIVWLQPARPSLTEH